MNKGKSLKISILDKRVNDLAIFFINKEMNTVTNLKHNYSKTDEFQNRKVI